ncbi:MAG: hypothetical protein JSR85_00410 [Proteobacteria bacterium]|nr:hypothetical protein [Pseudomonadota bacterium]
MNNLINLLAPLISSVLLPSLNPLSRREPPHYGRCAMNFIAFFLLVGAYILGCIALYSYLTPLWGTALSLLTLCVSLFVTSLILIGIGALIKPKKPPSVDFSSIVEKTVSRLSEDKALRKTLSTIAPISLATLIAVVVAAAYCAHSKQK